MVRLHTSLLAFTLATGSVLASSNEYQRGSELDNQVQSHTKSEQGAVPNRIIKFRCGLACAGRNNLQSRGFVDNLKEDLFVRDLDDLEARGPTHTGTHNIGIKSGKQFITGPALTYEDNQSHASSQHPRGLEDNEDLVVRDLDASDDLEAREPSRLSAVGTAFKYGKKISRHINSQDVLNGIDTGAQIYNTLHSRDLDASDDLEAREPSEFSAIGKAFKHINGHDILNGIDTGAQIYNTLHSRDLDASDDLEAREPSEFSAIGKAFKHINGHDILNGIDTGAQIYNTLHSRDLEAQTRKTPVLSTAASAFKLGRELAKHKHVKHILNGIDYEQQIDDALQSRDPVEGNWERVGYGLVHNRAFDDLD